MNINICMYEHIYVTTNFIKLNCETLDTQKKNEIIIYLV